VAIIFDDLPESFNAQLPAKRLHLTLWQSSNSGFAMRSRICAEPMKAVAAFQAGHITCSFSPGEKARMRGKVAPQYLANSDPACVTFGQIAKEIPRQKAGCAPPKPPRGKPRTQN
jgi:hypothetical protein